MILWTVAHQAPFSMESSRPEYWSGLPSPPPGALPDPGTEPLLPASPGLAGRLPLSLLGRLLEFHTTYKKHTNFKNEGKLKNYFKKLKE